MPGPGDDTPGSLRALAASGPRMPTASRSSTRLRTRSSGRLTKDEFDSRVSHAFAARTHADLAPLTADLPLVPPEARGKPSWRPENTTPSNSARVVGASDRAHGRRVGGRLAQRHRQPAGRRAGPGLTFVWIGIVCLCGSVLLQAQLDKRRRRQLRSGPGDAGQLPGGGGSSGRTLSADPATWRGQVSTASRSPKRPGAP